MSSKGSGASFDAKLSKFEALKIEEGRFPDFNEAGVLGPWLLPILAIVSLEGSQPQLQNEPSADFSA